jgi:hypothetical protein
VTAALPWRRHRALADLREAWPELEAAGEQGPPDRALLAAILARSDPAGRTWTLVDPAAARRNYEAAILDGQIPTRAGSWHDTFNVLAFVRFPHSKAALHRRCHALQAERGRVGPRGREEDALAGIDETALLVAGTPAQIAAFEQARHTHDLHALDPIVRGEGLRVEVFGHALLEHLILDRPPIGAGVLTLALAGPPTRASVDQALAARIEAGEFPRPCLSPTLPWPDPIVDAWLG